MEPVERALLRSYRGSGTRARLHTTLRWRSAPLAEVAEVVPTDGRVLDYGCGHGLLALHLAQRSTGVRVLGVDTDPEKLRIARATARALGVADRVTFEPIGEGWAPPVRGFDAVTLIDVLYLMPATTVARTLAEARAALRPGGRLVVKEMADRPRWKRDMTATQEQLAVRLLGITHGQVVRLPSEDEIRSAMDASGLVVDRLDLGRGSLHPHLAFIGHLPTRSSRCAAERH